MAEHITKKDLDGAVDRIQEYIDTRLEHEIAPLRSGMQEIQLSIQELVTTLDHFLKRLTDFEDEFTIMKAEIKKVKAVLKEKLNVDINS